MDLVLRIEDPPVRDFKMRITPWRKLPVSLTELCLDTTLRCGQSFRWRKSDDNIWSCALHGRVLSLRQDVDHLHYRAIFPSTSESSPHSSSSKPIESCDEVDDTEALLCHYLNLAPDLTSLYKQWSTADPNFNKKAPKFAGVRILKQDAWEALIGFICSSNNNIIRISQMMEKLCIAYGPLIGRLESTSYHDMPPPAALSGASVESHLRQLGFGYRAKYINQTAAMICREHPSWLDELRNPESPVLGNKVASAGEMLAGGRPGYRSAHEKLLTLQGVGPKVADCVCLMGLGWGEAVPVDTHGNDVLECWMISFTDGLHMGLVWQIAQRDYQFGKGKYRSLTKATYDAIGDHFRSLWGKEAGWAHSVLFTADLRAFSAKVTIKPDVSEEAEGIGEMWENVKSEVSDFQTDGGSLEKCEQIYTSDETVSKKGMKREIADSDRAATVVAEQLSSRSKAKRRRARW